MTFMRKTNFSEKGKVLKMGENELFNVLKEHGQEHIFEAYKKLDNAGKEKLAAQIERIDWSIVSIAGQKDHTQKRGKLEPLSALDQSRKSRRCTFSRRTGNETWFRWTKGKIQYWYHKRYVYF